MTSRFLGEMTRLPFNSATNLSLTLLGKSRMVNYDPGTAIADVELVAVG